jgi:hypothetical protein
MHVVAMFAFPRNLSASRSMIFAGIVGSLFFGWLTFVEFSAPAWRPIAKSELTCFRGRAEHVMVAPMRYGALNYRIWLEDQPVAFQMLRTSGGKQIDPAEFRAIEPGAEIVVGVEKARADRPAVDRRLNQPFLSFVSLEVDKKAIGSLADYNAWRVESSKRSFFYPGMLVLGVGLFAIGIAIGRASSKEEDHERSIRGLVRGDGDLPSEGPLREGKEI